MSDIDWIAEDDWSKVTVGQKVRVTNSEGELTFLVELVAPTALWVKSKAGFYSEKIHGWSLFVEAPPAVVLPSEDGLYESSTGGVWRAFEGVLVSLTNPSMCLEPAKFAPYTKLAPVPVTAKKVLDRMSSFWEFGMPKSIFDEICAVGREFGVEGDQ
jgi:hypothetical protein